MDLEIVARYGGLYIPIEVKLDEQYFNFNPAFKVDEKRAAIHKIVQGVLEFYNREPMTDKLKNYDIVGCVLGFDKDR